MAWCEPIGWILLAPLWRSLIPGMNPIRYSIVGYLSLLGVFFVVSKLTKMPLIGVFASFVGDVLIKIWLSVGIIILIISIFCSLG